jgi:hypothetical protein
VLNLFFFTNVQAGLRFLQPGSKPGVKALTDEYNINYTTQVWQLPGVGVQPPVKFSTPQFTCLRHLWGSVSTPPQFITLDNMHAELDVGHFFKPNPTQNFSTQPNSIHKIFIITQPNPNQPKNLHAIIYLFTGSIVSVHYHIFMAYHPSALMQQFCAVVGCISG